MAKPKEKFKTYGNVFDHFTERVLFKLMCQGHFEEETLSPVSIGKEGNVFSARKKDGGMVVVKIYRLEACDFNRLFDYIRLDPRFENLARKRRKVIFAWAQREFRNLMKAREVIRVPTPITFEKNVLVMEMIGDDRPAPMLKDAHIRDPASTFDRIIENVKKLYEAGFVHGDLSEFNILLWNDEPVFIDFSQCSPKDSPRATEFLERDIRNICRFFAKQGLERDAGIIFGEIRKSKT